MLAQGNILLEADKISRTITQGENKRTSRLKMSSMPTRFHHVKVQCKITFLCLLGREVIDRLQTFLGTARERSATSKTVGGRLSRMKCYRKKPCLQFAHQAMGFFPPQNFDKISESEQRGHRRM